MRMGIFFIFCGVWFLFNGFLYRFCFVGDLSVILFIFIVEWFFMLIERMGVIWRGVGVVFWNIWVGWLSNGLLNVVDEEWVCDGWVMDWGMVVGGCFVVFIWKDVGCLSGMEDGGGSMFVVLVDMVEGLGWGKVVLLVSVGWGMVWLIEIVGLEMGFLMSFGLGFGWSGGKVWCVGLLFVFLMIEFLENILDEYEVVCGLDIFFCVGVFGFILVNMVEFSWFLIVFFKVVVFLVFIVGVVVVVVVCFIVEVLSVFVLCWMRFVGGNVVVWDGVVMGKLVGWWVGFLRFVSLIKVFFCFMGVWVMGDGGRLWYGELMFVWMELKWCEERIGMVIGFVWVILSGEELKFNEFDLFDCGVNVCKGVDICKGVDVCKIVDDFVGFKFWGEWYFLVILKWNLLRIFSFWNIIFDFWFEKLESFNFFMLSCGIFVWRVSVLGWCELDKICYCCYFVDLVCFVFLCEVF